MEQSLIKSLIQSGVLASVIALSGMVTLVSAQTRSRSNSRVNNGACLTGTYRLNQSRSDDANSVAETATRNLSGNRDQVRDNLVRRLEAPEVLSLDQRGRMVTMASTRGQEVTFEADGRTRTEPTAQGRNTSVRAWLSRNQLDVTTTGNRGSDYGVTFEAVDNCRGLRVTRRLSNDRLGQPVIARSVYERTSDTAQADVYAGGNTTPGYYRSRDDRSRDDRQRDRRDGNSERRNGSFLIPDGTQLNTVLENDLTTKNTRDGDRFTLTVRSPSAYNGAVIEGFVRDAQRSGRITGRAGINLEFDRIRLRDGRSGEFAGTVESVRTTDGSEVRVDQESGVRDDDNQGTRTATRSGVGAALGAIIGAIAGGGKGAAIGAVVGAGAGAGSVIVQGRDDLDLRRGTEVTLRASAPRT